MKSPADKKDDGPEPRARDKQFECGRCNGRGFVFHHDIYTATRISCPACGGSGKVRS